MSARPDHGPMYICVMIGLAMVSLSILIAGPVPTSVIADLSWTTQQLLASVIFIGSVMCIIGSSMCSKYFFPFADQRSAYAWGIGGSISTAISVELYFIFIVKGASSPVLSGLAAGLSLMIPIGALLNARLFLNKRRTITEEIVKRVPDGEISSGE